MATSFGYEYVVAAPDQAKVVEGLLLPECPVSHQSGYYCNNPIMIRVGSCNPDPKSGSLILTTPPPQGCGQKELLQAVGVIGAIIMPHNLYLHR